MAILSDELMEEILANVNHVLNKAGHPTAACVVLVIEGHNANTISSFDPELIGPALHDFLENYDAHPERRRKILNQ